jgi:NAD-dependent SIR2 family protein deacetylase
MNQPISEEQENLLRQFKDEELHPSELIKRFYFFLDRKPKEEPLSPAWIDFWKKYRHYAREMIHGRLLKVIEESIGSIKMINEKIWGIRVGKDTRVTFLLGAGSSAPSGIPTVDKLLSELWKRARRIGREDLDRLAGWCERERITNIEDLLTAAYISNFAARNRSITSLLDYFLFSGGSIPPKEKRYLIREGESVKTLEMDVSAISFLQDTLQTLFGLLTSTMISANPNPTHKAIVDFIRSHMNVSIITTNYDGCMDQAILEAGIGLRGTITSEDEKKNSSNTVELIKMHGSINWAYCDSCQDVREFDLLKLKETYEKDELSYPVMGICKNCGGLRRPLLVPPLSFKFLMFPNLIDVWNSARQAIDRADYLIVVGYSFSEADTYITKIVSRSMTVNENQKMIIVNTNPNLVPYLRERFSSHIDRFDQERILEANENCEKVLPEILDSMLGKGEVKKQKKSISKSTKKKDQGQDTVQ